MADIKYIAFAEWLAENHYKLIKVSKEEKIWVSESDADKKEKVIERTTKELLKKWLTQ